MARSAALSRVEKAMYEKYKIGEISKITGIPIQTIRYYETQGILSPQKDSNSNYRYYDAWDINFLLQYRYFRSLELTVKETEQVIKNSSIEDIKEKLYDQQAVILKKIGHYQELMEMATNQTSNIDKIEQNLGKLLPLTNPPFFFCLTRVGESFRKGSQPSLGIAATLQRNIELMPLALPTFQIHGWNSEDSKDNLEYCWGWSLTLEQATRKQISMTAPMTYIPPMNCLYTVFTAYGKGTFLSEFRDQVMAPVAKSNYIIAGVPTGRLLLRAHQEGKMHRYFEVWVPVSPAA